MKNDNLFLFCSVSFCKKIFQSFLFALNTVTQNIKTFLRPINYLKSAIIQLSNDLKSKFEWPKLNKKMHLLLPFSRNLKESHTLNYGALSNDTKCS